MNLAAPQKLKTEEGGKEGAAKLGSNNPYAAPQPYGNRYQNQGYQSYPRNLSYRPAENRPRLSYNVSPAYQGDIAHIEQENQHPVDQYWNNPEHKHQNNDDHGWQPEQGYDGYNGYENYNQDTTEQDNILEEVNFISISKTHSHSCTKYNSKFPSKYKLFEHLRGICWKPKDGQPQISLIPDAIKVSTEYTPSSKPPTRRRHPMNPFRSTREPQTDDYPVHIDGHDTKLTSLPAIPELIESSVQPDASSLPGLDFRRWKYATCGVSWSQATNAPKTDVCLNSGCPVTLIDRTYLLRQCPNTELKRLATPIPVRGMGNKIIKTSDYIIIPIYIKGTVDGKTAKYKMNVEAHVVEDLQANALIANNTMKPQRIIINFAKDALTITKYQNLRTSINIHARPDSNTKRVVKTRKAIIIPPRSISDIPVLFSHLLPENRDFLFEPTCMRDLGPEGGVIAHIADADISFVRIRNNSASEVRIPRKLKLGMLVEFDTETHVYICSSEHVSLAVCNSWKSTAKKGVIALAALVAASQTTYLSLSTLASKSMIRQPPTLNADIPAIPSPFQKPPLSQDSPPQRIRIDPSLEHILPNGITIYGTKAEATQIAQVTYDYPEIWSNAGKTVDIPEPE